MEVKELCFEKCLEWRNWLKKNHLKEERVLLIRHKKHTGRGSFNQREAMDEAICFGWIDTTAKRVDDNLWGVYFVRRNKNSKWSDNTFARAEEMIKQGKMSEFGMKMYQEGLKKPKHDEGIPKDPDMPEELKKELEKPKNKDSKEAFEKLAKSYRRAYFRWILRAKREETRRDRVKKAIELVKAGKRLGV